MLTCLQNLPMLILLMRSLLSWTALRGMRQHCSLPLPTVWMLLCTPDLR